MQRCRKSQTEKNLEPYIVFCLTKIDHPEVYKKSLGLKAEESLLKLLGTKVKLGWLSTFFYTEIDKKTNKLNPNPNQNNRCQVMRISCFGVDGHGNSPVFKPESNNEKKEEKEEKTNTSQNVDPIFQNSDPDENDPYEDSTPSKNPYNDDQSRGGPKLYKINPDQELHPINMLSPIEWIVKGIEQYYPQVSSDPVEENT
jgi:hypothetical protein